MSGASVLIVAESGRTRDSLESLVASLEQVGAVARAGDLATAKAVIGRIRPALVILYASLPQRQTWTLLTWLRLTHPELPSLVLATNSRHQQQAATLGATCTLLTGVPVDQFFAAIEQALWSQPVTYGPHHNHQEG